MVIRFSEEFEKEFKKHNKEKQTRLKIQALENEVRELQAALNKCQDEKK